MGDIADMMLEGTLCAGCGVYLGEDDNGYPTYCEDCKREGFGEQPKKEKKKCPQCKKSFNGDQGLNAHIKAKHTQ